MVQPPSLVLFDMDDVLFVFDRPARLARLANLTGLSEAFIHEVVWASGFDDECDRGIHPAEAIPGMLSTRLGISISGEDFMAARTGAMALDGAVWELVTRLQPSTELALLTNNGPLLKAALTRAFPQVAEIFGERLFFSSEFKSSKTEPELFPRVLTRLGHRPEATLFVDDSAEYIGSAREAGLRTHHFQGAEGLAEELARQGLL